MTGKTTFNRFDLERRFRLISPALRLAVKEGSQGMKVYFGRTRRRGTKWRRLNPEALKRMPLTKESIQVRTAYLKDLLKIEEHALEILSVHKTLNTATNMTRAGRTADQTGPVYETASRKLNELYEMLGANELPGLKRIVEIEQIKIAVSTLGKPKRVRMIAGAQARERARGKSSAGSYPNAGANVVWVTENDSRVMVAITSSALRRITSRRIIELQKAIAQLHADLAPVRKELSYLQKGNQAKLYVFYDTMQKQGRQIL